MQVLPPGTQKGHMLPTGLGAESHGRELLRLWEVHPSTTGLHVHLQDEWAQPGQGLSHAQPLITCQGNKQVLPWILNAEQ